MSGHNDGGPAFPLTVPVEFQFANNGMSLRDWFAGQAASAILGGLAAAQVSSGRDDAQAIASAAYILADAMLAARNKEPS